MEDFHRAQMSAPYMGGPTQFYQSQYNPSMPMYGGGPASIYSGRGPGSVYSAAQ
jgi:hypothetical protein